MGRHLGRFKGCLGASAGGQVFQLGRERSASLGEIAERVYKSWTYDIIAIVIGVVIYGLFFWRLHQLLIGVPVLVM